MKLGSRRPLLPNEADQPCEITTFEMTATFEVAVGFLRFGKWEDAIDHQTQTALSDGSVHQKKQVSMS